jgi:hypothetical protein
MQAFCRSAIFVWVFRLSKTMDPSRESEAGRGVARLWYLCRQRHRYHSRPRFPFSKIYCHSNGEAACAIPCTRRTPRGRVVQHGSQIAADRITRAAGGAALSALAVAVAWFGIRINAWYGSTLGRTAEAGTLLSGLSVSADVLALILPTTACTLWTDRRRMAAAVAWALWTITIATALMATVGFAALNIADTTAARAKTVTERAALTARIEQLRTERGGITESRSVAAEITAAWPTTVTRSRCPLALTRMTQKPLSAFW